MVRKLSARWHRGTFKREFALIAFGCWLVFVHVPNALLALLKDPAMVTAYGASYSIATTMMWGYILTAFGADFVHKQLLKPPGATP